jgi:hypothetical protein
MGKAIAPARSAFQFGSRLLGIVSRTIAKSQFSSQPVSALFAQAIRTIRQPCTSSNAYVERAITIGSESLDVEIDELEKLHQF